MREPPIFSIRLLHGRIDLVAVAQLILPVSWASASRLSNSSAHVTDTLVICNDSVSEGLPSSEYGRGVLLSTLHYDSEACVKRH